MILRVLVLLALVALSACANGKIGGEARYISPDGPSCGENYRRGGCPGGG